MTKKFLKVRKQTLIYSFLILSMWAPPVFLRIASFHTLVNMCRIISMVYILFSFVKNQRKAKIGLGGLLILLYFGSFIVSTLATHGSVIHAINCVAPQTLFLMYSDQELHLNPKEYVICFARILKWYIIINAFILILFPEGVGRFIPGYNFMQVDSRLSLLGLDNGYLRWFLVAIVLFYFAYNDSKRRKNIMYAIMLATMIFVFSGTGIVCITLMYIYIYLFDSNRLSKSMNYYVCILVGFALQIGIVTFRVMEQFSDFLVEVLGKDVTFTGRTLLWDQAIYLITRQPVTGYGLYDYDLLISSANGQAYSAHNTLLQMMLNGGVIALVCFCIFVFFCGIYVKKSRNQFGKSILSVAILIMFINGITENMVLDQQIYFLYILGYNIENISNAFSYENSNSRRAGEMMDVHL